VESLTADGEALERYLRDCQAEQERLRRTKPTDSRLRVLLKDAVPISLRGRARMVATDLMAVRERRRAAALAARQGLRLHLGSGGEHKDGWVNVDLLGDPVELAWNLARPLPLPSGSAEAIFHEHLLEHLSLADGAALLRECHRVLRPGGVLRIGVPDAGRLVRSCANGGAGLIEETRPGRPTPLLAMQEMFYWHRHLTMYDFETLRFLCRACGFAEVKERAFGDSDLPDCPDSESRRAETLYVETVR
jgi:predicted SAM-dependent methyltransferase